MNKHTKMSIAGLKADISKIERQVAALLESSRQLVKEAEAKYADSDADVRLSNPQLHSLRQMLAVYTNLYAGKPLTAITFDTHREYRRGK